MVLRVDSWKNGFFLRDDNLKDFAKKGDSDDTWTGKFAGRIFIGQPNNIVDYDLNPTTYPGRFPLFWIMLTILPAHDGAKIIKFKEAIHFGNPNHQKYMQTIHHQKEQLEAKIKQGLISISQSISDLELMEHDLRKYREYKKYLDDYFSNPSPDDEEAQKRKRLADRFLKMIFVEQVDYYAGSMGQGPGRFSLAFLRNNNIMPTIVDDFLEIRRIEDIDEVIAKNKKLSAAERNILITKFKAFEEWLQMFKEAVYNRLERLESLYRSRLKTVEEFKKWVRPHIARLKALSDMMDEPAGTEEYFKLDRYTQVTGLYRYTADLWIIKDIMIPYDRMEYRPKVMEYDFSANPGEDYYDHPLNPYNEWNQKNLIFNYTYGLVSDYPWITKEWADGKAKAAWGWLGSTKDRKFTLYYLFLHVWVKNDYYSHPEIEDPDFIYNPILMSHNAVLAKLMEQEANKEEFEMYVDEVIGLKHHIDGRSIVGYHKEGKTYVLNKDFINKWIKDSTGKIKDLFGERRDGVISRLQKYGYDAGSSSIVLTKEQFFDVFPQNEFYAVEHFKENKFLAFIEDNIVGHAIRWKYDLPYLTHMKDNVTKVYYKMVEKEYKALAVNPIMSVLPLPK